MDGQRLNYRQALKHQFELIQRSTANNGFSVSPTAFLNKWEVLMDGPPGTLYENGKFRALLIFPNSFPYRPPMLQFITDILHPNIDKRGIVCVSVLHPPGNDPYGTETAAERWHCNRTVESILVAVQLLLAEPNFNSPANLDAAILYRSDRSRYEAEVRRCAERSATMTVPTTPPSPMLLPPPPPPPPSDDNDSR